MSPPSLKCIWRVGWLSGRQLMRPRLESLAMGVYLPFSCAMHVVLPWSWPSHGSYLSQGLPAVAWTLHESGYPLLVLELMALRPPFSSLCYCFELSRPEASLWCLSLVLLSWRRLNPATPLLGDTLTWRRLSKATLPTGDALNRRCLRRSICWLSSLGPTRGHTTRWLWLLVSARGRDGTEIDHFC